MSSLNVTTNATSPYSYSIAPSIGGSPITGTSSESIFSQTVSPSIYNLQLTDISSGAQIHSSTITVNGDTNVYAQATYPVDQTTSGISSTPISSGTFQSQNTQANIMIPPTGDELFQAPNGQVGKYFTSQDARLYIGGVFIDENIFVQFTLQDNKIPIYGYRSRFYDAMAQGRSLVQGQLGLNFVSEGYLYTVLKEYNRSFLSAENSSQTTLNNLVYTKNQIQNRLAQQALTGNTSNNDTIQLNAINQYISNLIAKGGVDLATAQNYATDTIPTFPNISEGYSNATYTDVVFDLVLQLEGAQRSVRRVIEGCQLIANDQVVDTSGNTLSDGYSFVARRVR